MSTKTIIEVGAPPGISEQISTLYRLLNEDLKEFEQHKFNILNLRHAKETTGLSPEREELLSQLVNTQSVLAARLHTLAQRKEALEKDLLGSTVGLVNVLEAVYSGTLIVIRNSVFEVMERLGPTTFYLEGDQIRQRPAGRIEKGAA